MNRSICCILLTALLALSICAQTPKREADAAFEAAEWSRAAAAFARVVEQAPTDGASWHRLGYALHAQGKLDEALLAHVRCATLPGPMAAIGAYNAACVHALKGDADASFTWLERARSKGFDDRQTLDGDQDLDALRKDPRFRAFRRSLSRPPLDVFVGTARRMESRVFFWNGSTSPGQLVLDFGPVKWKAKYAAMADSKSIVGRRWRLGSNGWTAFEANIDVELGGKKIPSGRYYVTLEKKDDGTFHLALLDPATIRATQLDAFQAEKTTGGIEIPLTHGKADTEAKELLIAFSKDAKDAGRGSLTIRFGPHTLATTWSTPFAKTK